MSAVGSCPGCGAALPRSGWDGLCPRCVAKVGLAGLLPTPAADRAASEATLPHPALQFPASMRLGDYELLEEIARGGMGVVYRARQRSLNRTVAVKMILAGPNPRPEFLQRFRTEAEAAAGLRHPNIVAIYDIAEEGGHPFFSMEYVAGRNLSQLLESGPLAPEHAARYVQKVAAAIHFAHEHGILHRDLKPSNILVDEFDEPRVTDFGVAKRLSSQLDLTTTGQLLGSPQYLAPEQMSSRRGEVGPSADVYSLGAVLYHLLAGHPPFQAPTMEQVLLEVIDVEPQPPLSIRHSANGSRLSDLNVICLKCLEKEPAQRYTSAQEVAEELSRFLAGEPIRARPQGAGERAWRWARKRPAIVAAFLMTAVALGAVVLALRKAKPVSEATMREPSLAFTFADSTFLETNWTFSVETNGLATQTASQIAEGQPGPCREIVTRVAGKSEALGFHFHRGAVYVPGLRGPITTLNVSMLAAVQEGLDNPLLSIVARQDGRHYLAPARAIAYGGWTDGGARALTARDFCVQVGFQRRAKEHPNFSASGGPIQFGFAVGDNDPRDGHRSILRLDNWRLEIRGPAPGELPVVDGEFAPADWSIYTDTDGAGANATGTRLKSGGNPGPCWQVTMTLSNSAAIMASCFHARALYDPAQEGPMDAINLFVDARQPVEAFGRNVNPVVMPAIAQGGRLFLVPRPEAVTHVTSSGGWLHLRFPGLHAGDLQEMRGWHARGGKDEAGTYDLDPLSHPDFSTNSAPLRIGFTIYRNAFYHTVDGEGFTAVTFFDNFRLEAQRNPALSAANLRKHGLEGELPTAGAGAILSRPAFSAAFANYGAILLTGSVHSPGPAAPTAAMRNQ